MIINIDSSPISDFEIAESYVPIRVSTTSFAETGNCIVIVANRADGMYTQIIENSETELFVTKYTDYLWSEMRDMMYSSQYQHWSPDSDYDTYVGLSDGQKRIIHLDRYTFKRNKRVACNRQTVLLLLKNLDTIINYVRESSRTSDFSWAAEGLIDDFKEVRYVLYYVWNKYKLGELAEIWKDDDSRGEMKKVLNLTKIQMLYFGADATSPFSLYPNLVEYPQNLNNAWKSILKFIISEVKP